MTRRLLLATLVLAGCGGAGDGTLDAGGDVSTTNDAATLDASIDAANDAPTTTDGSTTTPDPSAPGPFPIAEKDATASIAATGDSIAIHVAYPTAAGPFPVVVFAHGFQLPMSQYYAYVTRLASFGYVALTADFPTSLVGNDNPKEAKDLVGAIDWAKSDATVGPKTDDTHAGMSGHSLGGKLALLAATYDPRVKAAFVLDPVDSGGPSGCTQPQCVVVKDLMPSLAIPTGFVGETTDSSGSFQACAPASDNYATFYAKTSSPSLEVTALGANHMSFLDDVATCGVTCSFCNAATAPNAQVHDMARALMVAFYERWMRGRTAYDAFLTGPQAQARYVATSEATIASK